MTVEHAMSKYAERVRAILVPPVLVSHMDLPDYVQWSKCGWYLKMHDNSYRFVCGLIEAHRETVAITDDGKAGK